MGRYDCSPFLRDDQMLGATKVDYNLFKKCIIPAVSPFKFSVKLPIWFCGVYLLYERNEVSVSKINTGCQNRKQIFEMANGVLKHYGSVN